MKTVNKIAAQGDVVFRRVAGLPENATPNEHRIVAHSETGHHHVAVGDARLYSTDNVLRSFLVARGPVEIEHQRPFDTHETLRLDGGEGEVVWEIVRQREWAPEGWRRVED